MIIGVGVDLVDIRRIERLLQKYGTQFIQKVFTLEEQAYASQRPHQARVYANRFAAKEAAAKALGTGMRGGVGWKDIEVCRAPSGAPSLCFHGRAHKKLLARLPFEYTGYSHVSFSDEPPYSTAFVVISALPSEIPNT